MPLYDFECSKCGDVIEVLCGMDDGYVCPKCLKPMNKLCNCTHFKLLYDPKKDKVDWEGNTSQYWNAVREQRAEGKKVKGINEN